MTRVFTKVIRNKVMDINLSNLQVIVVDRDAEVHEVAKSDMT